MDAIEEQKMFAVKLADGDWMRASARMPVIFWYKHKATQHARFFKGSRVVEVELTECLPS